MFPPGQDGRTAPAIPGRIGTYDRFFAAARMGTRACSTVIAVLVYNVNLATQLPDHPAPPTF
jgi:hypothetical protein